MENYEHPFQGEFGGAGNDAYIHMSRDEVDQYHVARATAEVTAMRSRTTLNRQTPLEVKQSEFLK